MKSHDKDFYPEIPEKRIEGPEWGWLQGRGILETRALGPCIGVSVYDPDQKLGFLGHFQGQSDSKQGFFEEMLAEVKARIPDLSKARIWIGGGTVGDKYPLIEEHRLEIEEDILKDRELIQNRVKSELVQEGTSLTVQWLEGSLAIDYEIDVETGKEKIKEIEYVEPDASEDDSSEGNRFY